MSALTPQLLGSTHCPHYSHTYSCVGTTSPKGIPASTDQITGIDQCLKVVPGKALGGKKGGRWDGDGSVVK